MMKLTFLSIAMLTLVGCASDSPVVIITETEPTPIESALSPELHRLFSELDRPGKYLPQFVLGDVNEDGTVNEIDAELLGQMVELGGEVDGLTCAAAGDLSGDGKIDFEDVKSYRGLINGEMMFDKTDLRIDYPLLYTQPSMPCAMNDLFFAATPATLAGEVASIFFLDEGLALEQIGIKVVMGAVEIIPNTVGFGFDVITSAAMLPGEKVILQMTIPGRGIFLYGFTILMPPSEIILAAFRAGSDDDDDGPRDTLPPTIYGEEDEGDECPLKDDGCEALIIDFFRYGAIYDLDMKTHERVEPQLKAIGCNVKAIYPSYLRAPIFGALFTGGGDQNKYINDTNLATLNRVNKAIDAHAKLLATGRALGIQMVLGHGDNMGWGVSFAAPSGQTYGTNPTIPRRNFHDKIYKAEFSPNEHRVCGNVALDYSCQSGYTPIIIQTLNNSGGASYTPVATTNHSLHAGYDMNIGRGESLTGDDAGGVREAVLRRRLEKLGEAIRAEIDDRKDENPVPPRYKRFRDSLEVYANKVTTISTYYIQHDGPDDLDSDHIEKFK